MSYNEKSDLYQTNLFRNAESFSSALIKFPIVTTKSAHPNNEKF